MTVAAVDVERHHALRTSIAPATAIIAVTTKPTARATIPAAAAAAASVISRRSQQRKRVKTNGSIAQNAPLQ
jgi:hypothetical protein